MADTIANKIDFSRIRFLIVERNRLSADLMQDILAMLGARAVRKRMDTAGAKAVLRADPIEIVLTEWDLEPESGIELTRWIRNDSASPDRFLPVIMVTARSEKDYVVAARDHGVTEFLAKPFTVEGLYARLVSVVARPRQFINMTGFFGPDRRRRALPYDGGERRQD